MRLALHFALSSELEWVGVAVAFLYCEQLLHSQPPALHRRLRPSLKSRTRTMNGGFVATVSVRRPRTLTLEL